MIDISQFFEWSYWTGDKSEIFRNVSLGITGIVGVFFLIWRTIAVDRSSRAAMRQSITAYDQLKLQITQATHVEKISSVQLEFSQKTLEVTNKTLTSNLDKMLFDKFMTNISRLSDADSTLKRSIAIIAVGELARSNAYFVGPAVSALWQLANATSPALELSIEGFTVDLSHSSAIKEKVSRLKKLPLAYWLDMRPALGFNPYFSIQSMSDEESEISPEHKNLIDYIYLFINSMSPALRNRFWHQAKARAKPEIQTYIDVISDIRKKWEWSLLLYQHLRLDGYVFTKKDCTEALLQEATLRGAMCYGADFSGANALACDFSYALLLKTNFSNADLSYSDFSYSMVEGAIFEGADVLGCSFINCEGLEESQLLKAKNVEKAFLKK